MKNLGNFINESIQGNSCVFVWDHFEPSDISCVIGKSSDIDKLINKLQHYSYQYEECDVKDSLYEVEWGNESCYISDLKCKNMKQFKKKLINDEFKGIFDEDDEWLCYENLFFIEMKKDDPECPKNEEELYEYYLSLINNSYIDGDSNSAKTIINIKKQTIEAGPGVYFVDVDEFIERFGEDK